MLFRSMANPNNDSDIESDPDDMNQTQFSTGSGGGPSQPLPDGDLTQIYARQYDEVQRMLQDGSTSAESVVQLGILLQQSSMLCHKEKKVRESLYGGSVLTVCAQLSKNQAKALDTNLCAFQLQSFAEGILGHATNRETERIEWDRLKDRTRRMFKRAPSFSYMFGSFQPTELPRKEPKERTKRANRVAAEKKEPEKVTNVAATEEGNDKAVQHVKKILRRAFRANNNKPISFFEFVLDPNFFHLTVENIFHLSFLLKNNNFAIRQENGGLPYIYPVSESEANNLQKGKKLQCITSISPELWETLVKEFEIRVPMIPPFA